MKKIILLLFLTSLSTPLSAFAESLKLPVPFATEIPDGRWVNPWKNACEEASIIMVEQYYLGNRSKKIPNAEAKKLMLPLFSWENKNFGSNEDTNATRTAKLINYYSSFQSEVKYNPTLEEIKEELSQGHPVISLHYGRGLKNSNIPFRNTGSSYHQIVLTGFDDKNKVFIANDPADQRSGLDYRYSYDTILNTLHDFNHETKKADGDPVVLFTRPKKIVSAQNEIYLIYNNKKYYVSHPKVFKNHRWSWGLVKAVDTDWLANLELAKVISE